jgi:hypothetical protein
MAPARFVCGTDARGNSGAVTRVETDVAGGGTSVADIGSEDGEGSGGEVALVAVTAAGLSVAVAAAAAAESVAAGIWSPIPAVDAPPQETMRPTKIESVQTSERDIACRLASGQGGRSIAAPLACES